MTSQDRTAEHARGRTAELRRAIVAGEYAPGADIVAQAVIAKVGMIRRTRKRMEILEGSRLVPEPRPPRRRFRPRTEPAYSPR
jgi:DNA-binding GntR family transcriptional regulator